MKQFGYKNNLGGGGGGGGKISYVHFLLTFFHFPCDLTLNKLCDHPLLSTYWFKHGNILTWLKHCWLTPKTVWDQDQDWQHVSPDLDPNCLTLCYCFWKNFLKKLILKKITKRQQKHGNEMNFMFCVFVSSDYLCSYVSLETVRYCYTMCLLLPRQSPRRCWKFFKTVYKIRLHESRVLDWRR